MTATTYTMTNSKPPNDTKIDPTSSLPIRKRFSFGYWVTVLLGVYAALVTIELLVFNDNWRWDTVFSYLFSEAILMGVLRTIYLTLWITVLGLVLGGVTAWCRMSPFPILRWFALIYIWVMRAMPPLVMLLMVFFFAALVPVLGIGVPFGPNIIEASTNDLMSRFGAAVIGLAIYLGAYSAEIFRAGIMSLPNGQFEAVRALGISPIKAYRHLLGPQLTRVITPPMANELITTFKTTSLVSVIGYSELLTTVQSIYARNFETIPLLTVAVIWYLFLTSIAMIGQGQLEKRMGRGYVRGASRTKPTNKREKTRAK